MFARREGAVGRTGVPEGTTHRRTALEEHTAIKHLVFELTGAPRKEWYDAVSSA